MPLSFGLNIKSKAGAAAPSKAAPPKQTPQAVFGADDDSDDEGASGAFASKSIPSKKATQDIAIFYGESEANPPKTTSSKPPSKPTPGQPPKKLAQPPKPSANLSALQTAKQLAEKDAAVDPNIYDYDGAYDALHAASNARKAAAEQDAAEKKPRYITNLLASADVRKKDQARAHDKAIQREREAEGDEFADKEKFVTGAYRTAQEEARRAEEEEKAKDELEAQKRRAEGMSAFYKGVMNQREADHAEMLRLAEGMSKEEIAASVAKSTEKSDAEVAKEMEKEGRKIQLNDEGQITDKRELLTGGLNVIPKKPASTSQPPKDSSNIRSKPQNLQPSYERRDGRAAQRERQSRMLEQQMEAAAKRQADEELEEQERRKKAAKSQKTETDISSAKERFLARKREREAEAAKKKQAAS